MGGFFFALPFTMLTSMYVASFSLLILFVHNLIWLVCDPKMCTYIHINIWKKWKVFSHSSSSLFFSNPKELTTFFLLLTEKHRISTKTWRNYCFAFTMKQSFLFYGDVMLRDTLSKLLWITCYTQKIIKSCLALHKV